MTRGSDPGSGDEADTDDQMLLQSLRQAAASTDPVPGHLSEFARLAPQLRQLDAELAELLEDSALTAVRDGHAESAKSFAGATTTIDIDISDGQLVGRLVPESAAAIRLETPFGPIEHTTCDERGRFILRLPRGILRIVAEHADAATTTQWFVL